MSFGARFLAFPDLFPARRAGEPWGDREVALDLPGGPYLISGLSAVQAAAEKVEVVQAVFVERAELLGALALAIRGSRAQQLVADSR